MSVRCFGPCVIDRGLTVRLDLGPRAGAAASPLFEHVTDRVIDEGNDARPANALAETFAADEAPVLEALKIGHDGAGCLARFARDLLRGGERRAEVFALLGVVPEAEQAHVCPEGARDRLALNPLGWKVLIEVCEPARD